MRTTSFILLILILSNAFAQNITNKAKLANEYYQQNEFDKALEIFNDLDNDRTAIPLIHSNYLHLLIDRGDFKLTERYLGKVLKYFPDNVQYNVDLVYLHHLSGEADKKSKTLGNLLDRYQVNQYQMSAIAQSLVRHQLYADALNVYDQARKVSIQSSAFALDKAAIYRIQNQKEEMTNEYILYAEGNPSNIGYVKNLFQNILTEAEDQEFLEEVLIEKIQKNPDVSLYSDLLIWLELQRKNFYGAFLQARALDRRKKLPGNESMRIARIAMDNQAWQDAIDIFEYIIEKYPDSYNYPTARRYLIKSQESKVRNTYPVDKVEIRRLVNEYNNLYEEVGVNPTTLEALRSKALLHAFYLQELDTAKEILNKIVQNNRAPSHLVAESKLDLGDIYLLTEEPWESTLLYSQVEKAHKDSPLAYEAKLRNARLNYFTGNFALAKSHLDILKLATTRKISNDAIALSLLISDNTAFDSTDQIMLDFAEAELLLFRNKTQGAIQILNELLNSNPGHSITDEIYWLMSKIDLEAGNYEKAIDFLSKITNNYKYDILADDAYFRQGVILQDHLKNFEEAQSVFQEFLKVHPGSLYAAEARKRIRQLRGDMIKDI